MRTKKCKICYEEVKKNDFPRPSANCKKGHSNDACGLCWKKYLSIEVMEIGNGDMPCILCGTQMKFKDFKRIMKCEKDVKQ